MTADPWAEEQDDRARDWARETVECPTYGLCTACGAIETTLIEATGTKDFSPIGESSVYPTGFGCELCS